MGKSVIMDHLRENKEFDGELQKGKTKKLKKSK